MKTDLLIIDPQNDFILNGAPMQVAGAQDDMLRLSSFILKHKYKIDKIYCTLDSHHQLHIAHHLFWRSGSNTEHPKPFTIITHNDVQSGRWAPFNDAHYDWAMKYTKSLEKNGRYQLCVWPTHALIGSEGHAVYNDVFQSLLYWEAERKNVEEDNTVNYIQKGSNIFTEHYSVVKADVTVEADPSTNTNTKLINSLKTADKVLVAGEAGSHCLAFSVRDIIDELGEKYLEKIVILEDATSPVPGFESLQEDFFKEMRAKNVEISTTDKYFS